MSMSCVYNHMMPDEREISDLMYHCMIHVNKICIKSCKFNQDICRILWGMIFGGVFPSIREDERRKDNLVRERCVRIAPLIRIHRTTPKMTLFRKIWQEHIRGAGLGQEGVLHRVLDHPAGHFRLLRELAGQRIRHHLDEAVLNARDNT